MVEEAANLTRFRHNFKDTVGIIFPEPILSKRSHLNWLLWLVNMKSSPGGYLWNPGCQAFPSQLSWSLDLILRFRDNWPTGVLTCCFRWSAPPGFLSVLSFKPGFPRQPLARRSTSWKPTCDSLWRSWCAGQWDHLQSDQGGQSQPDRHLQSYCAE